MEKAWVDTGFLVALFARNDSHHEEAKAFIKDNQSLEMHSIWPVIVEACFFLNNQGKQALLKWVERGALTMHDITPRDTPLIREVIEQYKILTQTLLMRHLLRWQGRVKSEKF